MTENDRDDFAALILGLSEALDRKPMSDIALAIYWETLKDFDIGQIRAACARHARDFERGQWMPRPADLIRQIGGGPRSALIAWSEVEHAMFKVGAYESVQFQDGTINAVVSDMGGWPRICGQDLDEPWTQKEFERRYEAYRSQGAELHERLMGIHEDANRRGRFLESVRPPVLIGDGGRPVLPEAEPARIGAGEKSR